MKKQQSIHLLRLLEDINDIYWKQRITDSVLSIEYLFDIKIKTKEISRKLLPPSRVQVAAIDELDLPHAYENIEIYGTTPPPVTVIQRNNFYYLFMGSVRALVYCLSGKDIDSIIVDVSRSQKSVSLINEANISISDYISKVGVSAYESKLYPPNSLSE